jgi:hypothetical protein
VPLSAVIISKKVILLLFITDSKRVKMDLEPVQNVFLMELISAEGS